MACEEIREEIQAWLDNELSPARRAAVEEHLRSCGPCREVLAELNAVSAAMGAWSERGTSSKFQFALDFKLANESVPAEKPKEAARQQARPRLQVVGAPKARKPSVFAVFTGWRAGAAAAVAVGVVIVLTVTMRPEREIRLPARSSGGNLYSALSAVAASGQMTDASVFAGLTSKRAVESERLDSSRVAKSDVIYSFLALVESQADQNAGRRLINLLAGHPEWQDPRPGTSVATWLDGLGAFLCPSACAADTMRDPLLIARQYEFQGRLREALTRYAGVTDAASAGRARLAEGAVKLRLGDIDGAEAALKQVASHADPVASAMAQELLVEVASARAARLQLAAARAAVVTGQDWHAVGLLEVQAYDFRSAANSFMKAANAAGPDEGEFSRQARFRSAWCQVESGQISTGVYGFKSIASADGKPGELDYAAILEQAIGLARIGKAAESVAVCAELAGTPPPNRSLEALCHFHKGIVELRDLKDREAAAESLGRVAAAGQGNLSYAAQVLLQTNGN